MSVEVSLDFQVVYGEGQNIMNLFDGFISNGWQCYDEDRKVRFLPVGDDDNDDWRDEMMSLTQLREIIKQKMINREVIGVILKWEDTDIGGSLLIWPDGNCSFMANRNRKILIGRVTDISWYLSKLVPAVNSNGIRMIGYKASEM
ncbi:hypothetical protein [Baia soyae]|uniref:Uncharacterized protein n=1 Tax=Baia soyae TaxID=1544746 RepID=A0A4R2SAB6_9BACL|nr:hypothetical protein [Baia soyae]TCP69405.1 hypothetical protein EDD57_10964 [Baia soyae]